MEDEMKGEKKIEKKVGELKSKAMFYILDRRAVNIRNICCIKIFQLNRTNIKC